MRRGTKGSKRGEAGDLASMLSLRLRSQVRASIRRALEESAEDAVGLLISHETQRAACWKKPSVHSQAPAVQYRDTHQDFIP